MTNRHGITMVEVLIVLAILSLLLALLLPAIQSSRQRARETVCKNNLHQLDIAVSQIAGGFSPAPPGFVGGWTIEVLPLIGQQNLEQSIPAGTTLADAGESLLRPPEIMLCPVRGSLDDIPEGTMFPSHYGLVTGPGRKSFSLFDAPIELQAPWASGPEMDVDSLRSSKGPHHGGYFRAHGYLEGVDFMEGGE